MGRYHSPGFPGCSQLDSDAGPVGSFPAIRAGSWGISSSGTRLKAGGRLLGHQLPVSWARNSPCHLSDPTTAGLDETYSHGSGSRKVPSAAMHIVQALRSSWPSQAGDVPLSGVAEGQSLRSCHLSVRPFPAHPILPAALLAKVSSIAMRIARKPVNMWSCCCSATRNTSGAKPSTAVLSEGGVERGWWCSPPVPMKPALY